MDRNYADAHYTTSRVDDSQDGFSAVELYRTRRSEGKNVRVARVVYWDACGDFFFETFNADIPVRLAEDLIGEAKTTIKIR
jgi:heme-degrading monooxygenase HmoA